MKFYSNKWDDYEIEAGHNSQNIRFLPFFFWLPYFWDSEIAFDVGIKVPKRFKTIKDTWAYHWELRDLDGQIVKQGNEAKQGDGIINITNKGFRRKITYWNSGKVRAVVLDNLRPHREYILYANFTTGANLKSDMFKIAAFTIEDRGSYQMQLFLILLTIALTLYFGGMARACGI